MNEKIRKIAVGFLSAVTVTAGCTAFEIIAAADEITYETPESVTVDEDVYYYLDSAEDLYWFAERVNGGERNTNAILAADIELNSEAYNGENGEELTVWTPVNNYSGTFDGAGFTISNLYCVSSATYSGLFGLSGGAVSNVNVKDGYVSGADYTGGICGYNDSYGTITGCTFSGSVSDSVYHIGGICGYNSGSISGCKNSGDISGISFVGGICGNGGSISRCINSGSISGGYYVGGICGESYKVFNCENSGSVTGVTCVGGIAGRNIISKISGCGNSGNITGTADENGVTGGYIGGIVGFASDITIEYCSNTGKVGGVGTDIGAVSGYMDTSCKIISCCYLEGTAGSGSGYADESTIGYYEVKTADEYARGEIAYLLNGMSSGTVSLYSAGSESDEDLFWYQNIDDTYGEKDAYPVTDSTHGVVYASKMQYCPDYIVITGYGNSAGSDIVEIYENGEYHTYENAKCIYCGVIEMTEPVQDENGSCLITNRPELYWFANEVNSGKADINAVLENDIVINETAYDGTNGDDLLEWMPIGNSNNYYTGIFDGNGYTISGLYCNEPDSEEGTGVFGWGYMCEIKNLGVVNSYFNGSFFTGGIAGFICDGIITNCFNESSVNGSFCIGGIAGEIVLEKAEAEINNCYNAGSVKGSVDAGGIAGASVMAETVSCHNYGAVEAGSYSGAIIGFSEEALVENCYYLEGTADDGIGSGEADGTEALSAEDFAGGKAAFLLNGGSSSKPVWYQELGADSYPVLDSDSLVVYKSILSDGYTNVLESDVWADGVIDEKDAAAVLKIASGIDEDSEPEINAAAADANGDGHTDIRDVIVILEYAEAVQPAA